MITPQKAIKLLQERLKDEKLIKHSLASAAIMRALAEVLDKDQELWEVVGLLHDLDFEETKDAPSQHGLKTAEILENLSLPSQAIRAVKAHNEKLGLARLDDLSIALASAETITGLIVATTLVHPKKRLSSLKPKSVTKKMKQKDFARSINRETIRESEKLGLELNEFVRISLEAMQRISRELGL